MPRSLPARARSLGDLERELTGRRDDQRLRLAGRGEVLVVGVVRAPRCAAAPGCRTPASCRCRCGPGRSGRCPSGRPRGSSPGWGRGSRCRRARARRRSREAPRALGRWSGSCRSMGADRGSSPGSSVGSCFGSPAVSGVSTPFPVSTLGPLRSKVVPRGAGRPTSVLSVGCGHDRHGGRTRRATVAFEDPAYRAAVVDLLGVITYGEI